MLKLFIHECSNILNTIKWIYLIVRFLHEILNASREGRVTWRTFLPPGCGRSGGTHNQEDRWDQSNVKKSLCKYSDTDYRFMARTF